MNSRLKNILLGSVFICLGIGIGIGIGAGIWSGSDDPADQDQGSQVDSGPRKKNLRISCELESDDPQIPDEEQDDTDGPFVEFYDEKLGNITGIIDHRTPEHDGVVKFLGNAEQNTMEIGI